MTVDRLAALPDAMSHIDCGDEQHTIRWTGGALVAMDHADPEGERALRALGGEPKRCIEVLDAWARCRSDSRVLSALSRGGDDYLQRPTDSGTPRPRSMRGSRAGGWVAYAPLGTASYSSTAAVRAAGGSPRRPEVGDDDLGLLATLNRSATRRLVATTTEELLAIGDTNVRPVLEASLFGRATSELRSWTGRADLDVVLEVIAAEETSITDDGEHLVVRLSLEWVGTVWARDLAVIGDLFVLRVLEASSSHVSLLTVDPSLQAVGVTTVTW